MLRELLDLAGLVLGAALAFRLAGPVGDFLTDRFGLTSEWARLGAGAVLFVGVGVGLSIAARVLGRALVLPGLRLANGLGGAAVAALWGAVLLSVALTLARALPLEEVSESVEESRVASLVSGPESPLTRLMSRVGGTRMIAALGRLDELIGRRRVVVEGDERVELEPVSADLLVASEAAAEELFLMLNQARLAAEVDPLAWSADLAPVALLHAEEQYQAGYLAHQSSTTGRVEDRTRAQGIRLASVGEVIALAVTTRAVSEALFDTDSTRMQLLSRTYDRVGIGVVSGPYGLLAVCVLGG